MPGNIVLSIVLSMSDSVTIAYECEPMNISYEYLIIKYIPISLSVHKFSQ